MTPSLIHRIIANLLSILISALCATASATSLNVGPGITSGSIYSGSGLVSDLHNPAAGALFRQQFRSTSHVRGAVSLGTQLEYGNVDDLFKLIDELSQRLSDGDSDNPGEGGDRPPPPSIDPENPELDELIEYLKKEVTTLGAVIGFIAAEGYTTAELGLNAPLLIDRDIWGGTLAFDFSFSSSAAAVGIADEIHWDLAQAEAALDAVRELTPDSPKTTFDLSGGIYLTIDPATGKTSLRVENDSTLLTKAANVYELRLSYSRQMLDTAHGQLYVGVQPKLLRLGSSNVASRIGSITDSESLFRDIRDAEFRYDTQLGADFGVFWQAPQYRLGAMLRNLNELTFTYPAMNTEKIKEPGVLRRLESSRYFQLERQVQVEGSVHSEDQRWNLGLAVDVNPIMDPIGNLNQWVHLAGHYRPQKTWLPSLRAGAHHNISGTQLGYVSAGVTLFKYINIDLGSAVNTVSIEGQELPRSLSLSAGINFAF